MKIAITGNTGFIGKALFSRLSDDKNYTLFPFDKNKYSLSSVETLKDFVKNKDIIIHLAGITQTKNYSDYYLVNTLGTANLLEAISLYGKPQTQFIFASSFAVYSEIATNEPLTEDKTSTIPRNHYGMSKLLTEELIGFYNRKNGIPVRILRIANPYGPGDIRSVISLFVNKIQKEQPISINGDGTQMRDYIYVQDVIDAITKAITYQGDTLLVNICSGKALQVDELVKKIEKIIGKKAIVQYNTNVHENGYWIGNPKKASELLNFRSSINIDTGLKKTIQG